MVCHFDIVQRCFLAEHNRLQPDFPTFKMDFSLFAA